MASNWKGTEDKKSVRFDNKGQVSFKQPGSKGKSVPLGGSGCKLMPDVKADKSDLSPSMSQVKPVDRFKTSKKS